MLDFLLRVKETRQNIPNVLHDLAIVRHEHRAAVNRCVVSDDKKARVDPLIHSTVT